MALFTQTYTFTNGTTADGGQVNTELVALGSSVNSITNDQINSAAAIAISKTALGTYTAWTTWTPTRAVSGGTPPTYTAEDMNRYTQVGNTITIQCIWRNATGGTPGSGTNSVTFTLPITAVNVGTTTFRLVGSGVLFNDGLLNEAISVRLSSTTTGVLYLASTATTNISGDKQNQISRYIFFTASYEAA